jgi:hypothetical protein
MSKDNVETIELNEISRVYMFPNNQELKIEGAEVCYINENGTHQLRNNKGEIYIIPYRWLGFKIQQKDKTETIVEREKEEVKE